MPSSLLWAVDVFGRVFHLSTAGRCWELCKDVQLEFKRVSAAQQCSWGIACDHQVYLYVHSSDVPIRYQEETYENQRWNPVDGFCDRLLPSDRWQWSDASGLQHQPLGGFQPPSEHWEWEADWFVDENFGGEPTEKAGWTYAIDFPATYTKDKKWNSCVRRRRWIRYRRYKSVDTWAKIPSEETGPLPDPFNDISCGGWEISEEPQGRLSLWAVSLQGKVWFRDGICHLNPEGTSWTEVVTPGEVVQISCGPGDLVWAVLWEGQLLVREGIGRDNPKGSSWVTVDSPSPEVGAIHVSVGVNVVWAVTKDRKVWFRRGVNSHNPCGSGWIGMVGEMVMVNVGLNDQVWGIGGEDRAVYFRQGVTASELSGKTWRAVTAPRDGDRSHSSSASSLASAGCFFGGEVRLPPRGPGTSEAEAALEAGKLAQPASPEWDEPAQSHVPKVTSDSFISELVSDKGRPEASQDPGSPSQEASRDPQWSNVDLEEAQTDLAAASTSDAADSSSLSSIATYNLGLEGPYGADEHPLWAWVTAGGCAVDAHTQLSWFSSPAGMSSSAQCMSLSITPAQTAAWRKQIFEQLSERSKREMENFQHYEQAIEQSVWVKKGTMQWWRDWKPHKWVDVRITLEQFSSTDGNRDGILFIYYTFNEEKKYLHVFINEVTILVPVQSDTKHTFAIYTAERTRQRWPIRLAAPTEQEMRDWLALLSKSSCDSRGVQGPPSKQAVWSTTCKGDVFVSEPSPSLEASPYPAPCDQMLWRQVGGHLRLVECNSLGIVWGIGYDHTAWVHTDGYGGGFFQGLLSSTDNIHTQTDIKSVYIYENQRWNPVTGYSSRGLPTDRYMWSDASGLQECTKDNTKPPSPQWAWVSEWTIDYGVPGGTDREGWQYAADFPATFHGYKTMKDFVRRRRWARKCKITTTGPWKEVPPLPLWDVTLLPCSSQGGAEQVSLWAISKKGDVLCRLGVTPQNAAGTSWLHVGTDQPFKSISVGGGYQVWAIARDGSAFYRGSVSAQNPAGDCWYHIPPPARQKLKQVSVGRTSVYTVDENGNLWYRQGLTPSYPQGSSWEHISNNVRKVSVGPLDQVWIIADKVQGSHSLSCGTVCHRVGVQPMEPKGQSWDYGIGGGWDHISVRGNSQDAPRIVIPSAAQAAAGRPSGNRAQLQLKEQEEMNGNAVSC
uniref:Tectonin beta-propeller repeat-containing protein 1 n=1 Tax=Lepisosteus oculatus TaxID=7918 RepID=W5MQ67_LEPOC|nr:PREDICTED: tectonin beta-propeller repeat-containing protein 1 isoform X1 [Lepisosteus oculatus]XP_015215748.1 PREDICTED: tectonin beta-propeller repeat-containing protein 1 isoform X1 [Lepisosteus oculatus]XP_015215749.1 PREDICTED: tectonin beta-propeller repeat-containing protein 1 isoform X1 [Lepisosteus oculatus]XP_015215750.1 PREDICTED: tectonin beta-propeller repeat-containing protein 1 isoform X1 [Lepisosteus oculatus]XP_015215751.1 PREDICTED: tectonin beta-propeller repeat-containing